MTTYNVITRDYLAHSLQTDDFTLSDGQKEAVRDYLTRNVEPRILNPFARISDRRALINEALHRCITNRILLVGVGKTLGKRQDWTTPSEELINAIYAQVVGLDVLQPLLDDPDITSITVLNHQTILYEKGGRTYESPYVFESQGRMIEVIKNLAIRGGQQLTPSKPTADLAFPPPNVVRIHLTIAPVTPRTGAFCALRRGREQTWTLDTLVTKGMMDNQVADFLRDLVRLPASCIIGGEPSSGKTTLLEVLLNSMRDQHIALLEQAAELNPGNNPYISFFEVPPASETVSLATLTIDSLRKNVQVVVIGETRGSEAGWLLFIAGAMKGILTTLHGRDARQVVNRMATNAQISGDPPISPFVGNKALAMDAVADAFDFVIHATQLPNGQRIIRDIHQIAGVKNDEFVLTPVFTSEIEVSQGPVGGKQLKVRWARNPDWGWPKDLKFALKMAPLRQDVALEEAGAFNLQNHRQYQQACLAADEGLLETALRLFVEVLRPNPNGYLDAESRLADVIRRMNKWEALEKKARYVLRRFNQFNDERRWEELQNSLRQLNEMVELRVVAGSIQNLQQYHRRVTEGLKYEKRWRSLRNEVKNWLDRGELREAVRVLRSVKHRWFNDNIQAEIFGLRLVALNRMASRPGILPEEKLKLYYEMFSLVDVDAGSKESARLMGSLVKQIMELEHSTGLKGATGGLLDEKDEGFLQGLAAMQSGEYAQAREIFAQLEGYRQADLFMKSLEALEGASNGKKKETAGG